MELIPVDPDDAAAVGLVARISNAAKAADSPWLYPDRPEMVAQLMRRGWGGDPVLFALARVDGVDVGFTSLEASTRDNLQLAWAHLVVDPAHRRRGHGTMMWGLTCAWAGSIQRPLVGADTIEGTAGEPFAAALGLRPKAWVIARQQQLAALPDAERDRIHAAAAEHAADYELLRISGPSPAGLLDDLARLTMAINDAPTDELEWEDEVYDADRVALVERNFESAGLRHYRVVARHRDTGELGGHTVALIDKVARDRGQQGDTAVARAHRGHRLGILLKTEMLRWLAEAEPGLERLQTWNAEANDHMIAVNEALGYQVMGRQLEYQHRTS